MARSAPDPHRWEQLAEVAHYSASVLAGLCHLSPRQLRRQFHQNLACSPQAWLDGLRTAAAKQRLSSGQLVKQVAAELGFKRASHFCRWFKMQNHTTPSQFAAAGKPCFSSAREHAGLGEPRV